MKLSNCLGMLLVLTTLASSAYAKEALEPPRVLPDGRTCYVPEVDHAGRLSCAVLEWSDGRFAVSGYFRKNVFIGTATLSWPDGRSYVGTSVDGRPHGKWGAMSWSSGAHYDGPWHLGKPCEAVTMRYRDGSVYQGEFGAHGTRHGYGTMKFADGTMYAGSWKNDKRDGYGLVTARDGTKCGEKWSNGNLLVRVLISAPGSLTVP